MREKEIRAIIFDFDGTLLDSFKEGLRRIEIICLLNEIPFSEHKQKILKLWGLPGEVMLEKGLGINKELAKKLYHQWELWDSFELVPLINGAKELLISNKIYGIRNVLLTSRKQAWLVLGRYGLNDFFHAVYGLEASEFKKPDPRVFDKILLELDGVGFSKDDVLFVGDTDVDAKCGIEAGLETAIVLTGNAEREGIIEIGVKRDNILSSIKDIPRRFKIKSTFL